MQKKITRFTDMWIRFQASSHGSTTPTDAAEHQGRLDAAVLRFASWMTEPACKISELRGRLHLVNEEHTSTLSRLAARVSLVVRILLWVIPALLFSVPAMGLRWAFRCRNEGLWRTGITAEKRWNGEQVKMLTWNVCAPGGQYSITDGGVLPWRERWQKVQQKIAEARAQIVCLSEVFDAAAALQMAEVLSHTYAHVLIAVGQRAVGVPSGMVLASEGPLEAVAFEAYPKEWLDSRTKNAEKGILSFTVPLNQRKLTVLTSHLQHSEKPQFPTEAERRCRRLQLARIADLADRALARQEAVVLTGDLNLEPQELLSEGRDAHLQPEQVSREPTWGGDRWCAATQDKEGSDALILDYTLGWKRSVARIETTLTETNFRGEVFRPQATSDHRGLLSTISVA